MFIGFSILIFIDIMIYIFYSDYNAFFNNIQNKKSLHYIYEKKAKKFNPRLS